MECCVVGVFLVGIFRKGVGCERKVVRINCRVLGWLLGLRIVRM